MAEQLELKFSKNTIQAINIYREAAQKESIGGDGFNVKFSPTQKEAIKAIIKEHNMNASTFLREALDVYIEVFPYRKKIMKHKDLLKVIIDRLS